MAKSIRKRMHSWLDRDLPGTFLGEEVGVRITKDYESGAYLTAIMHHDLRLAKADTYALTARNIDITPNVLRGQLCPAPCTRGDFVIEKIPIILRKN